MAELEITVQKSKHFDDAVVSNPRSECCHAPIRILDGIISCTECSEMIPIPDPDCTTPFTSDGNREPAPKKEAWRPRDEYYYTITGWGEVHKEYKGENTIHASVSFGNYFPCTPEGRAEAEQVAEEIKKVFLKHKNL